jgi:hypothetical protein
MKLLISLLILIFINNVAIAKGSPKPTRMGWVCKGYNTLECGSGGCCKVVYIYQYPKNVDTMIKENPEFKKEICDALDPYEPNKLSVDCYGDIDGTLTYYSSRNIIYEGCGSNRREIEKVYINSCYDLWKYDPYYDTTFSMNLRLEMENTCNRILKKVIKKTGKLY